MSGEDTPLDEALWRKSRRSVGNGACVEVTEAVSGIAVRDTTDRSGPRITYSAAAWRNFGQSVRQGHFAVQE
jgi:hypothetical protein